nr:retrovirus-related Pol polyprotein from transposon TNT 1-94 [Tanacetum cinerariifolium]
MFRINPSKTSREEKQVLNTVSTSARTKPITVSQPHVITKKDVNSDLNGLSSTGVDNTKTRRPQPRSNTKHDRPKKVGTRESLATPKPRKSTLLLRWSPTGRLLTKKVIQICLWCVDSGCSKHMTGNLKLLINFVWKFMGTVRFRNDHVAAILGFGQFCDSNLEVAFRRVACFVRNLEGADLLKGDRSTNLYTINLHEMAFASPICLMARASSTKSWLWHQRLSHLNFDTINDLARNDIVAGLPKFKYHKEHFCPSCEQGKSKRASHPPKPVPNSRQRLHLLHMDLYGPMRIASINGKRYVLVIVDDYSSYTWVHFLRSKDEAPEVIIKFLKRITVLLQSPVIIIRTDNGTEFKNQVLKEYLDTTLVEAARTMLIFSRAPLFLWAEAIATACFTQNRSIIHHCFNKTPYELINRRKPDISFLYVFSPLCYLKNDRKDIGKLGAKGDISFFIGYSADSYAYRVYNSQTKKIMETMNVSFDELLAMPFEQRSLKPGLNSMTSGQISSGLDLTYALSTITMQQPSEGELDLLFEDMFDDYIGGQPSTTARTVRLLKNLKNQLRSDGDMCMYALSVSTMEPKNVKEAMTDPAWIDSMQEELLQFKRLDVWVLVPAPDNISPLFLKWLFKNKHDEEQTVIKNKMEAIRIFLAYAEYKSFTVFQMHVKTAFLHGSLKEDVYVCQPEGFIDADHPSHVYKLKKALYGLKQAPRACRFEMSMMGEMTFFLSLQVNQSPCGIFINQSKYVLEILKKYGTKSCDPVGTPMEIKDKLDLDQNGTPVDAMKYYSMIGALMYLTSSRPYIVHATCLCARYQAKPAEKHLKEVKRIFRYLWGTVNTAIAISCNPVQHSRTKHIAVSYHFINEHVEKGTIELYFVKTDYQLADIFTKALPTDRFNYLVRYLARAEGIYPGTLPLDRVEVLVTNGNPSKVNIKQLCGRICRLRYNLTLAESKFKNPMLEHQDKYMMKAQVHVLKSSAIFDVQPLPRRKHYCQIYQVVKHMLRGRLLASFEDHEHEGGDTQS